MWSTINIIRRKSPCPQMAQRRGNEGAALLKLESGRASVGRQPNPRANRVASSGVGSEEEGMETNAGNETKPH